MSGLFDTHCHLNLEEHFPSPEQEIRLAHESGVERLCVVGIDVASSRRALELAKSYQGVYAIVGWHPSGANEFSPKAIDDLERLAGDPNCVAVGEIGLDFHWKTATFEEQKSCLDAQLDLARRLGKPVVFHCREAYPELLAALESRDPWPYLFHCFSGSADDLGRALRLGAKLGVDGPVTYPKATDLRKLLARSPRDAWVLETDSPYLSPVPFRGKPNRPAHLRWVAQEVARVWRADFEEVAEQTTRTACEFFGISV